MKILIIAVGKLKDEAESRLFRRYEERFSALLRMTGLGPLQVNEIAEARAANALQRKKVEAAAILRLQPADYRFVVLDRHGDTASTEDFAGWLRQWRDEGTAGIAFAIGGPDGHGESVLQSADKRLSLGRLTLPHGLARIVLAEQLYRVATILAGHPYHRS